MKPYVVLEKQIGQTPLAALAAWKTQNPVYADLRASYAGRLDPMASGKLLVLLGEECKKQKNYTKLDKEYEIEVLLSVGSDTGDVLGLIDPTQQAYVIDREMFARVLEKERGPHMRAYPIFSSKTVVGKPLFLYALEGTLRTITVPEHLEHIYTITVPEVLHISKNDLEKRVNSLLQCVPRTDEPSKRLGADFRIDAIRARWGEWFGSTAQDTFQIVRLRVVCASGTYMRALAGRIGEVLGTKALALSIHRTKIGTYMPLWRGAGVWVQKF